MCKRVITAEGIARHLDTQVFGRRLELAASLPSTNTRCRELARAGAPEGTAVVALEQTAGRGRRGRPFFSPVGGVYLSVLLRPQKAVSPGLITCCGAVAVLEAIRSLCDAPVGIKWVNDILLHNRKLCGILAEGEPIATGGFSYVVLGFGINGGQQAFPPELEKIATSLSKEGYTVDGEKLIAAVLNELERVYTALADGNFMDTYRRYSLVIGRDVTVYRGTEQFTATAEAVDDDGGLLVRTATGERQVLHFGEEVSVRW